MGSPIIFSGNSAKLLKPILDFFGAAQILSGAVDPSSVATSAPRGSLYLNTTSGTTYKKTDNGLTTSWLAMPNTGQWSLDTFSGTGAQTAFTLSSAPGSINNTFVSINGVLQLKATYTVVGTTLTFTEAPPTGTNNIDVSYGASITIGTPADGSVTTAKIADGAVTTIKIADGSITDAKLNLTMFTKPVSYTPTWTGVGTPVTSTLWWKRDNSEIVIWGTMKSGTVSTNAITFTLPSGLTIDTSKFASSPARSHSFGTGKRLLSDVTAFLNYSDGIRAGVFAVAYNGTNAPQICDNSSSSVYGDVNGSTILSSGDSLNIEQVRIPITEWA